MKRFTLLLLSNALLQIALATGLANDSINKIDDQGRKQGKWVIYNTENIAGYSPNQKIEEGVFVDSKKTGQWTTYFSSGSIKSVVTFENNRPNGYAVVYHENGQIEEEGEWKNNRWVGKYKRYYDNGNVQHEFNHDNMGKRTGVQKYFYENGKLMIEGDWKEGKEAGIVKEYYENGDLKSEKNFSNGVLDTTKVKRFEPQKPVVVEKKKAELPATEEVPKTSVIVKPDEKPNAPGEIFNGEGYHKLYNKNKQISKDGLFKKGKLFEGKVFHYSEDGILYRISIYKDGQYIGDGIIDEKQ